MIPKAKIVLSITVGLLATAIVALYLGGTWSDPITATVVDAETGQPIEGVVVVADWGLMGGFEGGNPVGHLAVMEAVTDKAGVFHFPAWGPRLSLYGALRAEQPEIFFFKNGYPYLQMGNTAASRRHGWVVKSVVDGTRVKLEKFRGTPKEYLENVRHFGRVLDSNLFRDDGACAWKQIPRMIHALYEQDQWFAAHGLEGGFNAPHHQLADAEESYQKMGCGSAKEFLKGVTK